MSMISRNDRDRRTAEQLSYRPMIINRYLNDFTGDSSVFPPLMRDVIYPLFRECMMPENCQADTRIMLVVSRYAQIMRGRRRRCD